MTKSKTYSFNNIFVFLSFFLVIGCGKTLSQSEPKVKVLNKNSAVEVGEFKLIKLQEISAFDGLPNDFANYKNQIEQFDFYLAQSPTQRSGGFIFEIISKSDLIIICLRRPDPMSIVTASLTNPIALIRVAKNFPVKGGLSYCD